MTDLFCRLRHAWKAKRQMFTIIVSGGSEQSWAVTPKQLIDMQSIRMERKERSSIIHGVRNTGKDAEHMIGRTVQFTFMFKIIEALQIPITAAMSNSWQASLQAPELFFFHKNIQTPARPCIPIVLNSST